MKRHKRIILFSSLVIVPLLVVGLYAIGYFYNAERSQNSYFSKLNTDIFDIEVDFENKSFFGLDGSGGNISVSIETTEEVSILELEENLQRLLSDSFTLNSTIPTTNYEMVKIDKSESEKDFCNFTTKNNYPGEWPSLSDYLTPDDCSELLPFYKLDAVWVFDAKSGAPVDCKSLVASGSNYSSFSSSLPDRQNYKLKIECQTKNSDELNPGSFCNTYVYRFCRHVDN